MDTDAIVLLDMFTQAYRMAGVLKAAGQGLSPSDKSEALLTCNMMINGWKIERLLTIYYKRTVCPVINGQKEYSVGPGLDFDVQRMEKFCGAGYLVNSGQTEAELPMQVAVSFQQYQTIISKNITSTYPLFLYYLPLVPGEPGQAPYGQVILWPVPNQDGRIAIYTQATLDMFSTADEIVYMPKGYQEMLTYNLAVRVHQRYPNATWDGQTIIRFAQTYKERVKNQQLQPILMGSDNGALGPGQYPRGYYDARTWNPYE